MFLSSTEHKVRFLRVSVRACSRNHYDTIIHTCGDVHPYIAASTHPYVLACERACVHAHVCMYIHIYLSTYILTGERTYGRNGSQTGGPSERLGGRLTHIHTYIWGMHALLEVHDGRRPSIAHFARSRESSAVGLHRLRLRCPQPQLAREITIGMIGVDGNMVKTRHSRFRCHIR